MLGGQLRGGVKGLWPLPGGAVRAEPPHRLRASLADHIEAVAEPTRGGGGERPGQRCLDARLGGSGGRRRGTGGSGRAALSRHRRGKPCAAWSWTRSGSVGSCVVGRAVAGTARGSVAVLVGSCPGAAWSLSGSWCRGGRARRRRVAEGGGVDGLVGPGDAAVRGQAGESVRPRICRSVGLADRAVDPTARRPAGTGSNWLTVPFWKASTLDVCQETPSVDVSNGHRALVVAEDLAGVEQLNAHHELAVIADETGRPSRGKRAAELGGPARLVPVPVLSHQDVGLAGEVVGQHGRATFGRGQA